ncbi:MAG TPA: hypothetical protein VMI55_06505 [Thermoplasmata archaeon]|nr:hypothetical protein [Thermoplasmata archaeon]
MAGRTVDLVAAGPCSPDPYDPAAPAWALAAGLAARGDRVRVLHPPGPSGGTPVDGVEAVRVDIPLRRPGAAVEGAELASAASRRIRVEADLVIRDPIGLGTLLGGRRRSGSTTLVGVVRGVELAAFDGVASHRHPVNLVERVETWRDRRSLRRLEREALAEADRLFYDDPEVPAALGREYSVDPRLLTPAPAPVLGGALPSREEARRQLRLPLDVLVVAAPVTSEDPNSPEAVAVQESFRRVRSLFVGARLVGVGAAAARTEPGVTWVPERTTSSLECAFVAADIALVAPSVPRFDPGSVLAMRSRCAVLASPTVRFATPPARAVQFAASSDPADLAAALAELLADPEGRRHLVEAGSAFAEGFDPERVATTIAVERRAVAA